MAIPTKANIALVNLSNRPIVQLPIMFTPQTIEWDSISNWAPIATIGRNNPFYHYVGGEDTISFILDWYAYDKARESAISSAKIVRSWSKSDGYNSRPPRIAIEFEGIFRNDEFIIESAPFTMSLFMRPNYVWNSETRTGSADQTLKPVQIKQELVLKKITSYNETHTLMQSY